MRRLFDFLVYGVIVAGILVMTRPGSQGPKLVTSIGRAVTGYAQGISGQQVTSF